MNGVVRTLAFLSGLAGATAGSAGPETRLSAGLTLAEEGTRRGDAWMLAAAARLLGDASALPPDMRPAPAAADPVADLLAEARLLSRGNPALLGYFDGLAPSALGAAVLEIGPAETVGVALRASDGAARFAVAPAGAALDLRFTDAEGRIICRGGAPVLTCSDPGVRRFAATSRETRAVRALLGQR